MAFIGPTRNVPLPFSSQQDSLFLPDWVGAGSEGLYLEAFSNTMLENGLSASPLPI
jgi:hypothetical protein